MSDFFMNGNWMLDMLEKHIWHGFTVGTVALAIVYTVCKLFPKMPADTMSWLYRLGYLKLITAFVFLKAISLRVPAYTPANSASAADTVIQISRHTSAVVVSSARSVVHPDAALYFMMLWGLVVIFAGIRIAHASCKTRTLRKSCSVIQDEELHRTLRDLCERMGIRRKPELLSGNVSGPMICGFLSPSIILPEGFSSEDIQLVLAHELAHVKRRDVMWAWLPMLAQWFFFFNPLVWLLRKEWLLAQEAACDAMTVDVTSASHAEYGRMLLTYVVPIPASRRLVAIGVSEPYNTLKRRLNIMLKSQNGSRKKSIIVGTIVLAIGVFASIFTVAYHSKNYAKRAQNTIHLLQTGKYQQFEAEFPASLRDREFPKAVTEEWARLVREFGPFSKCTVVSAGPVNDRYSKYRVDLVCEFERGKRYLLIKYDKSGSIGSFCMGPKPLQVR